MKLLLLDNYDSFTYNLYQYLVELGASVTVVRNDTLAVDAFCALPADALILSPGPGRPEHAGIMNDVIRYEQGKRPILGVCLGHQAIAQVCGGTVTYAPELMHGRTSEITHDNSTLFRNVPSPFIATRYHSLVADRVTLPSDLCVTAETADGTIMAMAHRSFPLYGLQFHPESILTVHGKDILRNFMESI